MIAAAQSADRPSRRRRVALTLATVVALVSPVIPASALPLGAVAAPQVRAEERATATYWFGEPVVESFVLGDSSLFSTLSFEHPEQTHPLPFHSFVVGRLYDCRGRVAYTRYANMDSEQHGTGPWRSQVSLDLSVPRTGGPFARWKVTVQAKGRKPVHLAVTDGGTGFQLGCDGGYRRARDLEWWPEYDAKRPVNAGFGTPVATLLRKHVGQFGRVTGAARVGARIRVAGARDPQGNPSACGLTMTVFPPKRPELSHVEGVQCDGWLQVPRIGYFKPDTGGRETKAPTRGKSLVISIGFGQRGHYYARHTRLGRIS